MRILSSSTDRVRRSLAFSSTLLSEIVKLSAELYKDDTKALIHGLESLDERTRTILTLRNALKDLEQKSHDAKTNDKDNAAKAKLARRKLEKTIKEFKYFVKKFTKKFKKSLNKFEIINFNLQTFLYREAKSFSHLSSHEAKRLKKILEANAKRARQESVQEKQPKELSFKDQEAISQYTIELYQRLHRVFEHIKHLSNKIFVGSKSLERHVLNMDTLVRERSLRSSRALGRRLKRTGIELSQLDHKISELEKRALKEPANPDNAHSDNIHKVIELYEDESENIESEIHRETILLKRLNEIIKGALIRTDHLKNVHVDKKTDRLLRHARVILEETFAETHKAFSRIEKMALHNRMDISRIGNTLIETLDDRQIPHALNAGKIWQPHIKKEAVDLARTSRPHTKKSRTSPQVQYKEAE